MKNLDLTQIFCITVHGDSYYKNRLKRLMYRQLFDEMHNVKGLFGNWDGDNVETEEEIDNKMESIYEELGGREFCCCDYERGDVQIEDDLIYFEKQSVQELVDEYAENEEQKEVLLQCLNLIN